MYNEMVSVLRIAQLVWLGAREQPDGIPVKRGLSLRSLVAAVLSRLF